MKPLVIINFKTYKQRKKNLEIAKIIEKIDKNIIIGVEPDEVYEIAHSTNLRVYSQHVDYFKPGRNTGYIIPESIKKDGAKGSFLNHSEHRLDFITLRKTIKRCKEVHLKTIVFAKDLKEAKKIQKLKPDYLVIEPPELVAGKKSISQERPDLIKNIAKNLKSRFLVGAGIHSYEDIKLAVKFGAKGIAISSAIMKSKNPEKKLKELIGLKYS